MKTFLINFFLELDDVNKLQDPPSWKRSYIIDGLIKKLELIFVVCNFWFKRCFHVYYSLNQFTQNNEQFGEAFSLSTFALMGAACWGSFPAYWLHSILKSSAVDKVQITLELHPMQALPNNDSWDTYSTAQ